MRTTSNQAAGQLGLQAKGSTVPGGQTGGRAGENENENKNEKMNNNKNNYKNPNQIQQTPLAHPRPTLS